MLGVDRLGWTCLALVAGLYVSASVRIARHMGRLGRRPWVWFFITLLLTALPAAVVMLRGGSPRDKRPTAPQTGEATESAGAGPPAARCPHCGGILDAAERRDQTPRLCPRCRLPLEEGRLA